LVDTILIHIFVEDKKTLTMAIRKTTHVAPKLNVQHNYITLKLPVEKWRDKQLNKLI